jgi:hypothetical protein
MARAPPTWSTPVIGFSCCDVENGVEVSDLTIDCNLQNINGSGCIGAVTLQGSNTKISRVKAINYGSENSSECWVMNIKCEAWFGPITNCIIEDCIIGQPASVTHTQGADGISITGAACGGGPGTGWVFGAEIRNCRMDGITCGMQGMPPYFHALALSTVCGGKMIGNELFNMGGSGMNCVSGNCGSFFDITIATNLFIDVYHGIIYGDDACGCSASYIIENIYLRDNIITIKDSGIGVSMGRYATNLVVTGNSVLAAGSGASTRGIMFFQGREVVLEDNLIDLKGNSGELYYDPSTVTFSSISNNRKSTPLVP